MDPGFVAGLGVARRAVGELRRELAPPRAADVHVREEALLQSRGYFLSPSLTLMGFSNLENSLPSKSLSHAM